MNRLAKCSILLVEEISLSIHTECLKTELNEKYGQYFGELTTKLTALGFTYNPDTQGFEKKGESGIIEQTVEQNETTPVVGFNAQ